MACAIHKCCSAQAFTPQNLLSTNFAGTPVVPFVRNEFFVVCPNARLQPSVSKSVANKGLTHKRGRNQSSRRSMNGVLYLGN